MDRNFEHPKYHAYEAEVESNAAFKMRGQKKRLTCGEADLANPGKSALCQSLSSAHW